MEETKVDEWSSTVVKDSTDFQQPAVSPSRWQENHGNFLVGFFCLILLLGGLVLAYRQNRFVPPTFPESQFIDTPSAEDRTVAKAGEESVTIEVVGAVNDTGQIAIAVFDGGSTFNQPAEAVLTHFGGVSEGKTSWKIRRALVPERFAVAAYHDENLDSELNRNRFGIPTERYGFSRDARGLVGPPSFQDAVIDRPEAGETIMITIR
jgi:uncharacterized protein (DUF2141 family)